MADGNLKCDNTVSLFIHAGKCRCRPGVKGLQCDQCPPHWHLAGHGCVPGPSHSCQRLKCQYGAVCRQMGTRVECSCQLNCSVHNQSATSPVWCVVHTLYLALQSNHLFPSCYQLVPLMEHSIHRSATFASTCVGCRREFT